jgi:thiol:disulfide interchange protein DsbD
VSGAKISNVIFPNALQHKDEFFGEVEVYRGELVISMDVEISQTGGRLGILKLVAKQQGCSDEGICFLPEEKILNFSFLSGLN